jgi:hypothetical protein
MLTAKENMKRTIEIAKNPDGPKPDRFVNQYEALQLVINPFFMWSPSPQKGQMRVKNLWGVINSWPDHVPGAFPEHNSPEDILIKDIERWRDYVTIPDVKQIPQELWDICQGMMDAIDGDKSFKAVFVAPGLFEQTHHFCSMQEALVNYLEYEDEMHDLIKMLTEWELELADLICSKLHPDVLFHHDDLGTEKNSFMSPEIEEEFLLEPYKEIYKYYHEHGCDYVVHHSDSYGVNLLPMMVEMGIDVWQGPMRTNHVDELLPEWRGKIAFMGNIDNKQVDFDGWTEKDCEIAAHSGCDDFDPMLGGYIPCITQGGPGSVYHGTYELIADYIDKINAERFGLDLQGIIDARMPHQIMF